MALNIEMGQNMIRSGDIREGLGGLRVRDLNAPAPSDKSFTEELKNVVKEVDGMQKDADTAAVDLATGHERSIHEAMIMLEKADVALRSLVAVRNKVLDAYREIMRMQV